MTSRQPSCITTPIYYPPGKFHTGSTYTTTAYDVLARYKCVINHEAFYLTGFDEYGQKTRQKAEEAGIAPQAYANGMAVGVKRLWEILEIPHDKFIYTIDDYREKVVVDVFEKLLAQGDIYLGEYSGWYSVPNGEFFTESQLEEAFRDENGKIIGGIAPSGHEVEWISEESYFLRLGKYTDRLVEFFHTHLDFAQSDGRINEIIKGFIEPDLGDLAVSRTSFTWGVKVSSNPKHVVYTWIDTFLNCATASGYGQKRHANLDKLWDEGTVFHMVGKDVLRFHSIYWPIMFMILDMRLPDRLIAYGWPVMKDGKVSKSKGNVVYPEVLVERYGLDPFHYCLTRSLSVGSDGTFTPEDYAGRINYELTSDLGNLLSHTTATTNKYFGDDVPAYVKNVIVFGAGLAGAVGERPTEYYKQMSTVGYSRALNMVWSVISHTNKYADETTPQVLVKDDTRRDELAVVMAHLVASLRVVARLIQLFVMVTLNVIMEQLGLGSDFDLENLTLANSPEGVKVVVRGTPIFPHLGMEIGIDYIKASTGGAAAAAKGEERNPADIELKNEKRAIKSSDFDKVKICVAEVKKVSKVKGPEKLLKFCLDAGDGEDRQVLSGTVKFYPDEQELIGEKLQIVASLKSHKIMGLLSRGMILSAEHDGSLIILAIDPSVPNGSQVG